MKKIVFILTVFISLVTKAQFTQPQFIGAPSTLLINKGGLQVNKLPEGTSKDSLISVLNGVFRRLGPLSFIAGRGLVADSGATVYDKDTVRLADEFLGLPDRVTALENQTTTTWVSFGVLADTAANIRASITPDSNFASTDLTNWTGVDRTHDFLNTGLWVKNLAWFEYDVNKPSYSGYANVQGFLSGATDPAVMLQAVSGDGNHTAQIQVGSQPDAVFAQVGMDGTYISFLPNKVTLSGLPGYASDAAADADATLQTNDLYRVTGDHNIHQK